MKLTTAILALGMTAGTAAAQNPNAIHTSRAQVAAAQQSSASATSSSTGAKAHARAPFSSKSVRSAKSKPRAARPKEEVAVESTEPSAAASEKPKVIALTGRRDPFVSPVVSQAGGGSGCSMGKRCLAVDQIALKGVVKSDAGMIAVVVNSLEKAYFLRENDPIFNGYVVRITGDSIIFKETVHDNLGKPFTREVTKKITTPAV